MSPSSDQDVDPPEQPPIIVAIGASAGGLEAFELFFKSVPLNCGIAFVVIQHLDPMQKGMLPELLQRITALKVAEATEGIAVEPDHVYVIPSNKDLSIEQGKLKLNEPIARRGFRLPIDIFFKSLANDQHARAMGIILSGMGSDGTLGLRAIKDNGGYCLVQAPNSAKFDAMPQSAIKAGLADTITIPEELWQHIDSQLHANHSKALDPSSPHGNLAFSDCALERIARLLRERTGNDFNLYKSSTIYRRIERRMGLHQVDNIDQYEIYLRENPSELDLLFKELLIGVTHFFRDTPVWEQLKDTVFPQLLALYPNGKDLRAWVVGCSTGEEAYSLAMIFQEVLAQNNPASLYKLQIFATDLDQDTIQKARQAYYPPTIQNDVSLKRLKRFFSAEPDGYRIKKEIREMVIFAQQNIISDPPFTKLDLLTCRNLLIYFSAELQKKLIPLFYYALSAKGILLLGNAESINNFTSLFTPIDSRNRLYQREDQGLTKLYIDFPNKHFPVDTMTVPANPVTQQPTLQSQFDQLILKQYSLPAVLITTEGDILQFNGRTGKYLEPAAGKANLNIYPMAREGIRYELASAIKEAQLQAEVVVINGLTVGTNGGSQKINLSVQKIVSQDLLNGLLIVIFTDVPTPPSRKRAGKSVTIEQQALLDTLEQTRAQLQTEREERQTALEELKSANEELQSTNEELQSSNEELTTSKEEMQSLNEELQTINAELQSKVTDLSWVNNDMNNLLNSMEVATIFLDNALNIRRFTTHATQLFKLINGDNGRPLSDIVTDLNYPQLQADIKEVLRTLVFIEKQVETFDGRWFKVRIMPYRTQDNVIDGVVATFIDITETKKLEAQLRSDQ